MTKICRACKQELPVEDFYPRGNNRFQSDCKLCKAEYNRNHYRRNATEYKVKATAWKKKNFFKIRADRFNVSEDFLRDLFEVASGKCMICGLPDESLHIDHCHTTGCVRGLLCAKCNHGIGLFKDSVINLQNAIQYLNNQQM